MLLQVNRQYKDQIIRIPIRTFKPERIVCRVKHYSKPYTYYFDASPVIRGVSSFTIKIPKMPPAVVVEIYNEKNGNSQFDSSFQIGNVTSKPIVVGFSASQIMDPTVQAFAKFSDEFAENAGILTAQNSIFVSPCGKYRIHYLDVIRDDKTGKPLRTPARINGRTGVIEISKKYYQNYTVPARKWTNWHEFSHVWKNKEQANELEADKNAIMIYLAAGNPIIEAYNGVYRIFKNAPSDLNRQRWNELNKFIRNSTGKLNQKLIPGATA